MWSSRRSARPALSRAAPLVAVEPLESGNVTGYASMTQASVGLQAGAQDYSEIVVFGTAEALNKFKDEKLEFDANASAVIIKAGAASAASFRDGVAVFAQTNAGAMA